MSRISPPVEIVILAGGLSSRMGQDKARLRLGPRTLLGHLRATAHSTGLPVRVIRRDLVPRCGPLGGLYTALKTTPAEAILFLSCDTPFISAGLIERILRCSGRRSLASFVEQGGLAGFPCLLRRAGLAAVEQQLAGKVFSLQALARALPAKRLTLPPRWAAELFNVNTPADWQVARELWRRKFRVKSA